MKDELTIRPYINSDKAVLLNILKLNTPKYFSPEEEVDLVYYLDNEIEYYYVIEINSQVVGGGGINFTEDKMTGKISWDLISPDFQGKSLGSALLNYRIERLKEFKGVQQIIVRTSQLVYKFYEKLGFTLFEIVEDYWAKGLDIVKKQE